MRQGYGVTLAGLLLVIVGNPGRGQAPTDLKPVVDKVLNAYGGEVRLRQLITFIEKTKTHHGTSESTLEIFVQLPDRVRLVISGKLSSSILVENGDQIWTKTSHNTAVGTKLTKAGAAADQGLLKFRGPRQLLRLTDPASKLSGLGEVKVDGRTTVGIQLIFKRYSGEVNQKWFFDKETGLLTKIEDTAKNVNGKELLIETLYSDYKKIDGIMIARKATFKTDGKVTGGSEVVEFKAVDKLDDSLFQKP